MASLAPENANAHRFGDNPLTSQVAKAFAVLTQMMVDRGHADTKLRAVTPAECTAMAAKRDTIELEAADGVLLVMYLTTRHNGTAVRADLKRRIAHHRRVIVVFRENPLNTDAMLTRLREEFRDVKFETFSLQDLQFNVTRHHLVPQHERISDPDAVKAVLRRYGVKRAQLPVIHKSDAVCRYYGIESGDLVRVTRVSPAGGSHEMYRMCV